LLCSSSTLVVSAKALVVSAKALVVGDAELRWHWCKPKRNLRPNRNLNPKRSPLSLKLNNLQSTQVMTSAMMKAQSVMTVQTKVFPQTAET